MKASVLGKVRVHVFSLHIAGGAELLMGGYEAKVHIYERNMQYIKHILTLITRVWNFVSPNM